MFQICCMLAWDWPALVFFRILAGIGGGMIPQLSQAIFYQIFPPGKRGMALGFALLGWSVGPAFGPLMGGNLLEVASWRVVYAISWPLSGLGFSLAWWLLPSLHHPERRRLDPLGLLTLAVAVSTLLLALTQESVKIEGRWLDAGTPAPYPRDRKPSCFQPLSTTAYLYKPLIYRAPPSFLTISSRTRVTST